MKYLARVDGRDYSVEVERGEKPGAYTARINGKTHLVDLVLTAHGWLFSLLLDGRSYQLAHTDGGIEVEGHHFAVVLERDFGLVRDRGAAAAGGPARLRAPIPGLVVAVQAQLGDSVSEGQPLVIVEAMKMQMELKSPRSG
ncbi:MAG: acetyl-CoA carboxylase biotin carboxyl carrier protein subunit, partial [Chloroflexota bacterium]